MKETEEEMLERKRREILAANQGDTPEQVNGASDNWIGTRHKLVVDQAA